MYIEYVKEKEVFLCFFNNIKINKIFLLIFIGYVYIKGSYFFILIF